MMKKKVLLAVLSALIVAAVAVPCFASIASKMVDNFENNRNLKTPEWWKFGNLTWSVVQVPPFRPGDRVAKTCGKYCLNIRGSASNWYCGGIGTYTGVDASTYTGVELNIFGYGEGSGRVKIELYDDDKGSYETLYDKNWVPLKDDIWAYEQNVDWRGWRTVYIPFSSFTLSNAKRGDGILNLDQNRGSGGLLQLQFVFLAGSANGEVNLYLDNIKLVAKDEDADE